jgi:hypothetical protein
MPVSGFVTTNYVTITGGEGSLKSIVFGDGTAWITGPKNGTSNDGSISAVTDCAT